MRFLMHSMLDTSPGFPSICLPPRAADIERMDQCLETQEIEY